MTRNDIRNFSMVLNALPNGSRIEIGNDFRAEKHGHFWSVASKGRAGWFHDCCFNHPAMAKAMLQNNDAKILDEGAAAWTY